MLKPAYQVSVIYPSVHPEQDINQRYPLSGFRNKNKNKENIWEADPKPYH